MRFLIDENLPYQLGASLGIDWVHATRVTDQATDSELWEFAKENQLTVITKDTDFFDRLLIGGAPPRVLWIRLGNLRKNDLIQILQKRWPLIENLIQKHDLVQIHDQTIEVMDFPKE